MSAHSTADYSSRRTTRRIGRPRKSVGRWRSDHLFLLHRKFLSAFLTPEQMAVAEKTEGVYRPDHIWSMHKWVDVHHIGQ